MARAEDFRQAAAELSALRREREAMVSREAQVRAEVAGTTGAIEESRQAEVRRQGVRREAAEVARRTERVESVEPRTVQASTRAIEENTQARKRNVQARREEAAAPVRGRRPLRGAGDPLFEQAVVGGYTSQYAMRQNLGVGQGRAAAMQAAMQAGFRPGSPGADRPFTRVQAAMLEAERAESDLTEATRQLNATRRRKSASDDERLGAVDSRNAARDRRDAARRELGSVRESEASRAAARAATDRQRRVTEYQSRHVEIPSDMWIKRTARGLGVPEVGKPGFEAHQEGGSYRVLARDEAGKLMGELTGAVKAGVAQNVGTLYTRPDRQRQGVASEMLRTLERSGVRIPPEAWQRSVLNPISESVRDAHLERRLADAPAIREARDKQAEAVRGTALVPRTPANAGYRTAEELRRAAPGPQYGEYPYAPVGRERVRGAREFEGAYSASTVQQRLAERNMFSRDAAVQSLKARAAATTELTEKENLLMRALSAEQRAIHEGAYAQAERNLSGMSAAQDRARASTRLAAVEFGTASQQMRRHGALTSEFIAAAARGETTMRELGFQATATIGKFAGWTAAAGAVYGALGAVQRLGEGAIQASSGVDQLQRVIPNADPGQTSRAFRDLAGEFNVPVETAADAVYRMGQRFHSLPEAVEAARASLYSFKTGEVDVATSTDNLIAIVNGFGLSADELSNVYDQINQAQNVFGIRIGDTEAGLAKAAGTFRNAGGDLNFLLALMTAIGRATNRSGTEIGTGISRAAVRIREARSQELLRSQGVTPTPDNLQTTLQNAMAAARAGGDAQILSQAVFGNQYARLITAVLNDQTTFNNALRDTSPEAAKGSAQRELQKVLSEVREELARTGVQLERFGSALADTGALDFLGVMLRGLNGIFGVGTRILDVFNSLPDGLRQAVVYATQIAAAMALMRRFGPSGLAERFPTLQPLVGSPDRRLQLHATRGARDQLQEVQNTRERLLRRQVSERIEQEAARRGLADFDNRVYNPAIASGNYPKGSEERLALAQRRNALEADLVRAEQQSARTAREMLQVRNVQVDAERELNRVQNMRASEVRNYLVRNRIPIPASLDTPNAQGAVFQRGPTTRQLPNYVQAPGGARYWNPAVSQRAVRFSELATRELEKARIGLQMMGVNTGQLARGIDRFSDAGMRRATSAVGRVDGALRRMRDAPGRLRSTLSNVTAGLGFLDKLLIGLIGFEVIKSQIDASNDRAREAVDALRSHPSSDKEQREYIQRARRESGPNFSDFVSDAARAPAKLLSDVTGVGNVESDVLRSEAREREAKFRADQVEYDRAMVKAARDARRDQGTRTPAPNSTRDEIVRFAREQAQDVRDGIISVAQFRSEIDERIEELANSRYVGPKNRRTGRNQLRAVLRNTLAEVAPEDFVAEIRDATDEELEAYQTFFTSQLSSGRGSTRRGGLRGLGAVLRQRIRNRRDDQSIEEVNASRDAIAGAIDAYSEETQRQLDLLGEATTNRGRRRALRSARRAARAPEREARRVVGTDRQRIADLKEQLGHAANSLNAAESQVSALNEYSGGSIGLLSPRRRRARVATLRARYQDILRQLKSAQRTLGVDIESLDAAIAATKDTLAQIEDDAYEGRSDRRQTTTDLNAARAGRQGGDAGRSGEIDARRRGAQQQLDDARTTYGPNSDEYRQALTEIYGIEAQANDMARSMAEDAERKAQEAADTARAVAGLKFDIQIARAEGDPIRQAQLARQKAADTRRRATTQQERLQATLDSVAANNEMEEAVNDREQARFEFLASVTDNPVKQARIEQRAARVERRGTRRGTAEWYRARARENQAKRNTLQERVDARREDIDFNLEMEHITTDVAVQQYRSLLNMTGLTKRMRRDILRRIKDLKNEGASDFELNVGDIPLPTMYEIRRAAGVARAGTSGPTTVVQAPTTIQVIGDGNPERTAEIVVRKLGRVYDTSTKASQRAAGRR